MNGVWILIAWVSSGHGQYSPVPTTEFARESLCQQAIVAILPNEDDVQRRRKLTCVNVIKAEK